MSWYKKAAGLGFTAFFTKTLSGITVGAGRAFVAKPFTLIAKAAVTTVTTVMVSYACFQGSQEWQKASAILLLEDDVERMSKLFDAIDFDNSGQVPRLFNLAIYLLFSSSFIGRCQRVS
jgi:hypothetical protein